MIDTEQLKDPTVRAVVAAINAGDRAAFFALLTPDATMSDDGTERDLEAWVDREVFDADGRMEVEEESADGRSLTAAYSNSTWGAMRTKWRFEIAGGKVSRFETGQA
jgi:hypothetical protein